MSSEWLAFKRFHQLKINLTRLVTIIPLQKWLTTGKSSWATVKIWTESVWRRKKRGHLRFWRKINQSTHYPATTKSSLLLMSSLMSVGSQNFPQSSNPEMFSKRKSLQLSFSINWRTQVVIKWSLPQFQKASHLMTRSLIIKSCWSLSFWRKTLKWLETAYQTLQQVWVAWTGSSIRTIQLTWLIWNSTLKLNKNIKQ